MTRDKRQQVADIRDVNWLGVQRVAELQAELSRLRGIVEEASRYAALGRACESNGLGWYGEDGTMLFQAPADVIEEQAIERLTPEQHRAFMHRKMGERMAASGDLGGDQSVSRATDDGVKLEEGHE